MADRRTFIKKSTIGLLSSLIGMDMVYGRYFPVGMLPIALYEADLPGKSPQMRVLNDRPINAETPAHLLDPTITSRELFFVRNNGIPPSKVDVDNWELIIEGESTIQKKTYTLQDLKSRFKKVTLKMVLECGGNGRSEFNPPAKGNQWSTGAVGCAEWTGVRLRDVLNDVGLKNDAVYVGYYGADTHLSGDPTKQSISRGVPMKKAFEPESLIAWQMNGEDLPALNGYPLRLVFGGYPASCSGKWLNRLVIRNKEHDGNKMGGQSYRVPCKPVAPGTKVADEDMCIIEDMPVKSIITYPKTGAMITLDQQLPIRGHSWTSATQISQVEYSIDFGKNWKRCTIKSGDNRYAWQDFNAEVSFPERGYYEVWARATDDRGDTQPIILPGWNPKGYLNNACHRIAVKVV